MKSKGKLVNMEKAALAESIYRFARDLYELEVLMEMPMESLRSLYSGLPNDGNVIELTDAMLEKDNGFPGSKHIERN